MDGIKIIFESLSGAWNYFRALPRKRKLVLAVIPFTLLLTALHILSEGDAFQTAEVVLAIILFW